MKPRTNLRLLSLLTALSMMFSLLPTAACAADAPQTRAYSFSVPIRSAADDLEERAADGSADAGSPDLELGYEDPDSPDVKPQIAGLRFTELLIPKGALITEAYIQFTVDETKPQANPFEVRITAENAGDSAPFGEGGSLPAYPLSSRAQTAQSVTWATGPDNRILWRTPGQAGRAQRTPDLSALLQAVVDTDGWAMGNSAAFFFAGSGNRTAVAYEGGRGEAAVLHVAFTAADEAQAAPQGLAASAPTTLYADTGVILGTADGMEYRPAGMETAKWAPCAAGETAGLASGDYEVRFAARIGYGAGDPALVHIPLYPGHLTLQPGADETQMNFTWYVNGSKSETGVLQVAPASAMADGAFPEAAAQTVTGEADWLKGGYRVTKATAAGLAPNTEYVYRVGDGGNWSSLFRFHTRDTAVYSAVLVGDPQIGASGDTQKDAEGWRQTVGRALETAPDAALMLSAGDQVQCWSCESQYEAFFAPAELRSLPLAPAPGNHDDGAPYERHFNVPNVSRYGRTGSGGDYWFTYGAALYMVLNTNNRSAEEHAAFIESAIAGAGEGVVWKIVMFHHSIYSSAAHSIEIGIASLRRMLHPLMDTYGIDVAFMGHDHCYTRTYQMLGNSAQNGLESVAVNPAGTLYVTTGSASASQFYPTQKAEDTAYRAVRWAEETASYSCMEVSAAALTLSAYRSDTGELIDRYTIVKDTSAPVSLAGAAPSAPGAADGRITGTTAAMEYRPASGSVWTACGDGETGGLNPGTYAVRYAGFTAETAVTVPDAPETANPLP